MDKKAQIPTRKGKRRSSIMVVEKTGETEEIFKNKGAVPGNEEKESQDKIQELKNKTEELKNQALSNSKIANELKDSKEEVLKSDQLKNEDKPNKSTENHKNAVLGSLNKEEPTNKTEKGEISEDKKNSLDNGNIKAKNENEGMVKEMKDEDFHTAEEDNKKEFANSESMPAKERAVAFDESKNTEMMVDRNEDKAIPAEVEEEKIKESIKEQMREQNERHPFAPGEPEEEAMLVQGCELEKIRSESKILFRGSIFKKLRFFSCFWVQRYFVLQKDGTLMYYKNLNSNGRLFLHTSKVNVVSREFKDSEKHPYQILLTYEGAERILAFDAPDIRDAWATKLSESIRDNKKDD